MTRMTGPDCAVMCNLINTHTHTTRSLLGSDTDMVFCYQIALWVSGECEIVGRTHSLSVQHYCCFMQLIISSSSVRGNGGRVEARDAV